MASAALGTLYLVATPIGNLGDISPRALETLRQAAVIACEDTRHSAKLLQHYGITTPTVSYYRENERERAEELRQRLRAGESVALISDAGMPLVSDPGGVLVAAAVAEGAAVVPIPGASAPMLALAASGWPPPTAWLGFAPAREGERRSWLREWAAFPGSLLFFEAPHRLAEMLAAMEEAWGGRRPVLVAREMTKLHEEYFRGTVQTAREHFTAAAVKGECTIVVGPAPAGEGEVPLAGAGLEEALRQAKTREDLRPLARQTGLSRSDLYRRWQQLQGKL